MIDKTKERAKRRNFIPKFKREEKIKAILNKKAKQTEKKYFNIQEQCVEKNQNEFICQLMTEGQ